MNCTIILRAVTLPVIVVQPVNVLDVESGSFVALSVEAMGISLTYSWQRMDGVPLTGNPRIEGVSTSRMTIREVQVGDSGVYLCEVSNTVGTIRSREVTISVSK